MSFKSLLIGDAETETDIKTFSKALTSLGLDTIGSDTFARLYYSLEQDAPIVDKETYYLLLADFVEAHGAGKDYEVLLQIIEDFYKSRGWKSRNI